MLACPRPHAPPTVFLHQTYLTVCSPHSRGISTSEGSGEITGDRGRQPTEVMTYIFFLALNKCIFLKHPIKLHFFGNRSLTHQETFLSVRCRPSSSPPSIYSSLERLRGHFLHHPSPDSHPGRAGCPIPRAPPSARLCLGAPSTHPGLLYFTCLSVSLSATQTTSAPKKAAVTFLTMFLHETNSAPTK